MINFNEPFYSQKTIDNILDALNRKHVSGDGAYTKLCNKWLEDKCKCEKVLLTHSCTAALEMAAMLADIKTGDEVIMPSFTFVSTANAFVLQGARPVFVDIREDTLNINEKLIENAITEKTKAIVPVHYAGVGCEMDTIMNIAKKHNLIVVEDAAQAFASSYKGKQLGTIGHLGAFSFHETKNVMSGEGGCLLANEPNFFERAEIIREKGTNRSKFFRGHVDKYTWVDKGSSYLPSDLIAAYLYSVLEQSEEIQKKRISVWNKYNNAFAEFESKGLLRRPYIPSECTNNAHMFYLLLNDLETRTAFISHLKTNGVTAPFHYIPLHSAPAGQTFGRFEGNMDVTNKVSDTLVRLPMFYDLSDEGIDFVIATASDFLRKL